VLKSGAGLRGVPEDYVVFVSIQLAIAITGFVFRNRMLHLLLPIVWLTFTLFYVLFSVVGRIDA